MKTVLVLTACLFVSTSAAQVEKWEYARVSSTYIYVIPNDGSGLKYQNLIYTWNDSGPSITVTSDKVFGDSGAFREFFNKITGTNEDIGLNVIKAYNSLGRIGWELAYCETTENGAEPSSKLITETCFFKRKI